MDILDARREVNQMVYDIRGKLAKMYNVVDDDSIHKDYRGLCDEASSMFSNEFNRKHYSEDERNPTAHCIHGEIRHAPHCESKYWPHQHTWVEVRIPKDYDYTRYDMLYVDITCSQFKHIFADIPDYYISTVPPKWYLKDSDNVVWKKGILRSINRRIRIPFKDRSGIHHCEGVIEFIQYEIWGRISDRYGLHISTKQK